MRYSFDGVGGAGSPGGWELNTDTYELRVDGEVVDVEPQVLDVLAYLISHRDRVVPKEELLDRVWGDRFVSESALTTRIKQARQAVGDDGQAQRVIRTVHRRGYRFVAEPRTDSAARTDSGPRTDPAARVDSAAGLAPVPPEPVPETHYVVNDGAAIAYQVFGTGPDLVLIGGFVSNVEVQWEHPAIARFLRGLASFCRVVVLDKRGTGVSERLGLGEVPPLEQRAGDVLAVMDAVGISRATVLGSSEGGSLSVVLAATQPQRVDRLILHGTWARHPWLDESDRPEFAWVQRRWGTGRILGRLAPTMAAVESGRRFLARYERQSATPGTARRLVETMAAIDVTAVLPSICVPTLIVHRNEDPVYGPEHARALAAGIPGARLVLLPGNDHFIYSGDTEPILDAVRFFVTGTSGPAAIPDRLLATILVAEVDGDRLDPAVQETIHRCLQANHAGAVTFAGPGVLSTFDGPGRAVRAAAEIRRALAPLGVDLRAGVHVGEVERRGATVSGFAVDATHGLARCAEPGSTLVSRTVTDLVAGCGLAFKPWDVSVDGLPRPVYLVVD